MADTTALDKVVERVRTTALMYPSLSLDALVKDARFCMPANFPLALQDPRYLAYCKEQDEKKQGPTILWTEYGSTYHKTQWSDGRVTFN